MIWTPDNLRNVPLYFCVHSLYQILTVYENLLVLDCAYSKLRVKQSSSFVELHYYPF